MEKWHFIIILVAAVFIVVASGKQRKARINELLGAEITNTAEELLSSRLKYLKLFKCPGRFCNIYRILAGSAESYFFDYAVRRFGGRSPTIIMMRSVVAFHQEGRHLPYFEFPSKTFIDKPFFLQGESLAYLERELKRKKWYIGGGGSWLVIAYDRMGDRIMRVPVSGIKPLMAKAGEIRDLIWQQFDRKELS